MKSVDVVQYFMDKGYQPHQAAAIAGNLTQESSLNPEIINKKSGAFGLAQWVGPRKKALDAFAQRQGSYATDPGTQLDFINHELNTTESRAKQKLMATSNLEDATNAFSNHFERAGANEKNNTRRVSLAQKALDFMIPTASASEDPYKASQEDFSKMSDADLQAALGDSPSQVPVDTADYSKMSDAEIKAALGQQTSQTQQPASTQEDYTKMSDAQLQAALGQPTTLVGNPVQSTGQEGLNSPEPTDYSIGDIGKFILPSIGNTVIGAASSLLHPSDTIKALTQGAVGGVAHLTGQEDKITPEAMETADSIGKFYKDRYGSLHNIEQTAITDPAGLAFDVSSIAAPIGALTKGLLKGTSKIAAPLLGLTTGTGTDTIGRAYQAGKAGGDAAAALKGNMRGAIPMSDTINTMKSALGNLANVRGSNYRSGIGDIFQDKTPLNFQPISQAVQDANKIDTFNGVSINPKTLKVQDKITKAVADWSEQDPAQFHTIEGLDSLKKYIGNIKDGTNFGTPQRAVANRSYNAVRGAIEQQAPGYAETMKNYADASKQLTELTKTFSLGEKATTDTALRKLQSIGRNNANTNFGNRTKLVEDMQNAGAPQMLNSIAGQSLSSWTPRGLQAAGATGLGGLSLYGHNPLLAASLLSTSPRLMGEVSQSLGTLERKVTPTLKGYGASGIAGAIQDRQATKKKK